MSTDYSIKVTLDVEFSKAALANILEKGKSLSFTYYKNDLLFEDIVTINEAVESFFNNVPDYSLNVKVGDEPDATYLSFGLYNRDWDTMLYFHWISERWSKKYLDGTEALDIPKYAQLAFKLSEGYLIREMIIEKS